MRKGLIGHFVAASIGFSLTACTPAFAHGSGIPLPRERPAEIVLTQTPQTNPDPFNTKHIDFLGQQTAQAQPAPTVNVSPPSVTVNSPPTKDGGILNWIQTSLMALFAAIAGKLAFKLPNLPQTPIDGSKVKDIVTAVLHPNGTSILSDPALKSSVDTALLQVIQSGVPGQAIQAGFGLIPGAAPFATTLEPVLRKIVISELQKGGIIAGVQDNSTQLQPGNPLEAKIADLTRMVQTLTQQSKP